MILLPAHLLLDLVCCLISCFWKHRSQARLSQWDIVKRVMACAKFGCEQTDRVSKNIMHQADHSKVRETKITAKTQNENAALSIQYNSFFGCILACVKSIKRSPTQLGQVLSNGCYGIKEHKLQLGLLVRRHAGEDTLEPPP